ncbi:hypothetical protein OLEAN_C19590 [Oleispira antarctica RB-8]|uniref:Sulfotransferase family protein n=1 Tax=Oleispira antarctica RB-8 TaxID=698738 RepID=R4YMY5_OLEAN|nr:hypothetical protein OLEAN_C19590 [Oleispira antarctica RB-8]
MNITKNLSRKIKAVLLSSAPIYIDVNDGSTVKGWAASSANKTASVVVCISSKSDCVCLLADKYRPDVRRVGLHDTGFCGYEYDVSLWKDKAITVSVQAIPDVKMNTDFSPSFFVHIPKTAGTSFKRAAESFFGKGGIVKNYGVKSIETAHWVKDTVLQEKDYPALYQRLKVEGIGLYTGHIHALPTAHVFPIRNVVTFVRRPQAQVLSHYHHYARWYGYEKTIEDFVKNLGFRNLQSRHLKGLPLQLVGFIGLTEKYDESIRLYNSYSGFNLEVREDNINSHNSATEVSDELSALIADHNKEDNVLYGQAVSLLNERSRLAKSGQDWCFSFIDRLDENAVTGVAYMQSDNKPVSLVIKHGGVVIDRCVANGFRPGLVQFGVPNKGFVGFSFPLPARFDHRDISVEVELTGQILQRKF